MEKHNFKTLLKKHILAGMVLLLSVIGLFSSCNSDDVGGNLYTFTDKMMGQYLKDSANFSEFTTLLDTTKVMGLLNSYGAYTCFAPTNQAMKNFYALKGKKSLKDFTLDSLKTIAYDHIINGTVVLYSNFIVGRLPELSMSDRYFSISFSATGTAYINTTSEIIQKDIVVHNGVIQKINQVLNPTRDGIVEAISKDSTFTLFYNALIKTGLADSLLKIKDPSFDPTLYTSLEDLTSTHEYDIEPPTSRKYGYTLLMEGNSTLNANGITDLASMKAYAASVYNQVYPADANITDITNRSNSLNRFIAYHIINKQLSYTKFIDAYDTDHMLKTRDMYEYIETMCPNTLIEIKKDRTLGKTNLINYLTESGKVIQIVKANSDKDATNGVYHEIDGMLEYSLAVHNQMSSKRLRFDTSSFFPELTNNNMRGLPEHGLSTSLKNTLFKLPRGYIDRITSSEQTQVGYLTPYAGYCDYEGDEIYLEATSGNLYDFSVITPPVPEGTYEIRFGYLANGARGVAQLYVDDIPCGVPLNMNVTGTSTDIGYETPGSVTDDPFGFLNDKMMRNRGYMKGPSVYHAPNGQYGYTGETARYESISLRHILGIYTFDKAGTHKLTVKGLSGGQFMFDYLEYVPTSAIESEDIY
jgi:uncharacterized surface protein with fasciclin (FAS1) repeats